MHPPILYEKNFFFCKFIFCKPFLSSFSLSSLFYTKLYTDHSTVNSPVSPHLQQNGYTSVANNQPNQIQQQQNYTPNGGVQGTWKGSNTLTYTQSMQPPDPRSQHNNYCKQNIYSKLLLLPTNPTTETNASIYFTIYVFMQGHTAINRCQAN